MNPKVLNPDSVILQQLDGHWQKIATMLLYKLVGRDKTVKLTNEDISAFSAAFAPGTPCLYTHGHVDSIDFTVIDQDAGRHIAAHDAAMAGRA